MVSPLAQSVCSCFLSNKISTIIDPAELCLVHQRKRSLLRASITMTQQNTHKILSSLKSTTQNQLASNPTVVQESLKPASNSRTLSPHLAHGHPRLLRPIWTHSGGGARAQGRCVLAILTYARGWSVNSSGGGGRPHGRRVLAILTTSRTPPADRVMRLIHQALAVKQPAKELIHHVISTVLLLARQRRSSRCQRSSLFNFIALCVSQMKSYSC